MLCRRRRRFLFSPPFMIPPPLRIIGSGSCRCCHVAPPSCSKVQAEFSVGNYSNCEYGLTGCSVRIRAGHAAVLSPPELVETSPTSGVRPVWSPCAAHAAVFFKGDCCSPRRKMTVCLSRARASKSPVATGLDCTWQIWLKVNKRCLIPPEPPCTVFV